MSGTAGEMKASLLLTLEDQLSGGLEKLLKAFGTLDETLKALTGKINAPFNKLDEQAEKSERQIGTLERMLRGFGETAGGVGRRFDEMWKSVEHSAIGRLGHSISEMSSHIGAFGAAAGAISFIEPIRQFAEYENRLRHIAITEHLSGDAADAEIKRLTKLLAEDAQASGQTSESVSQAYSDFATSGLPVAVIDKIIRQHSMAATAYNISPEALGPAVLSLIQTMKVPEADIGSAIAAMAEAAKSGRFKIEDFAREFPGVSGMLSLLGMGGRGGADYGFAALETIMKNSSEPNQAAAGFVDALRYITDNAGKNAFGRAGVDIHQIEVAGAKHGRNPLDSVLDFLQALTKGKNAIDAAAILGDLLHNQQAGLAIQALLAHRDENDALKAGLDKKDSSAFMTDFVTAMKDPVVLLRMFQENLEQLSRRIGELFVPVLQTVTIGLHGLMEAVDWLDEHFPVGTKIVGEFVGVFLALGAAIGTIGLVLGAASPVGLALTALVTTGILLYTHWDDVKRIFHEFADWLSDWALSRIKIAVNDIKSAWGDLRDFFTRLWKDIRQPFDDFMASFSNSWLGRQLGVPMPAPPGHPGDGPANALRPQDRFIGDTHSSVVKLHVSADPGLKVQATSDSPHVIPSIGPGAMWGDSNAVLGRP